MSELPDEDLSALFQAADSTSLSGQKLFLRATLLRLLALVLAATFGALVGRITPRDYLALGAVIAFAIALAAELFLLRRRPERTWYEGRAAAESSKTLAWRYGVGGEPFGLESDGDVDALFLGRLRDILKDLREVNLEPRLDASEQITSKMRELREQPLDRRKQAYKLDRIEDQRVWYTRKAGWNQKRATLWLTAAVSAEVLGLVTGALVFAGVNIDLLGVVAAVAAGIAAWLQTKQHETLSRAYGVAALELATVSSELDAQANESEWGAFVNEAEEAISREHTLWRASRGVQAGWEKK